jgi:hypothetical protein
MTASPIDFHSFVATNNKDNLNKETVVTRSIVTQDEKFSPHRDINVSPVAANVSNRSGI